MIADTEVLFAFSEDDQNHQDILSLLKKNQHKIQIPYIAIFEMLTILQSKNLPPNDIQQIFKAIEDVMKIYKVQYAIFSIPGLTRGVQIHRDIFLSKKGKFFDALMIGIEMEFKQPLLANDHIFYEDWLKGRLPEFRAVKFKEARLS